MLIGNKCRMYYVNLSNVYCMDGVFDVIPSDGILKIRRSSSIVVIMQHDAGLGDFGFNEFRNSCEIGVGTF